GSPVTILEPERLPVASTVESAIPQPFTLFFLSKLISPASLASSSSRGTILVLALTKSYLGPNSRPSLLYFSEISEPRIAVVTANPLSKKLRTFSPAPVPLKYSIQAKESRTTARLRARRSCFSGHLP